jgi:hypothetical protein
MIERSHGPFKVALQDWMQENNNTNWSIGSYIVQYNMNRRTSDSRGDSIPYESYYGVSSVRSFENTFGNISGNVETEVGLCKKQRL